MRDGNIVHKPCQRCGIVGDRNDDLKLVSYEFCILVTNMNTLANFECFCGHLPVSIFISSKTVFAMYNAHWYYKNIGVFFPQS